MAQDFNTLLYAGQGVVRAADLDVNNLPLGFKDLGNVMQLALGTAVERRQKREMRTGKQHLLKSQVRQITQSITMMLDSFASDNLKRFYYGGVDTLNGATITNEIVTGRPGLGVQLSRINLSSFTSLTNAGATVTYTRDTGAVNPGPFAVTFDPDTDTFALGAGSAPGNGTRVQLAGTLPSGFSTATNYYVIGSSGASFQLSATQGGSAILSTQAGSGITYNLFFDYKVNLKSGMIDFPVGTLITDGQSLRANFVAGASELIKPFTDVSKPIYLLFEGLNTAQGDTPVIVECFKFVPNPPSTWEFINESDYAGMEITGELEYSEAFEDFGGLFRERQVAA